MTSPKRCPQCDAPLPAGAPQGLCPACLLARGLESSPSAVAATEDSPSARFVPPKPSDLAPLFPQLELLDLVGHGGMGAVYKARQKGLDRLVALKILPPEVGRDPKFADRFTREAKALARLNHPHIVTVHDVGRAGDYYFFVMEYVDGLNLREAIRAGRLSPQEAMAIVPQICDALQYAHDEGIVHRDIKPENILIDKKGRVKIADFGLAKLLRRGVDDLSLTQDRQVMGTPRYMAPEQMQGSAEVDHRVDIYSLGVVFYEMLTGELPMGRFALPSQKVQVDVRLDEVVLRALDAEPQRRYQQASEVKTSVETIAASPRRPAAPPVHGPRRRSHGPWVALTVLLGCAAMCVLPTMFAAIVFYLWAAAAQRTESAQRAEAQRVDAQRAEAERALEHRLRTEGQPRQNPPPQGFADVTPRALEFRLVPAETKDRDEWPHIGKNEFDGLVDELRDKGPQQVGEKDGWRWLEAGAKLEIDDLPTGQYGDRRFVLVSDRREDGVDARPVKVSAVYEGDSRSLEFELDHTAGEQLRKLTAAHIGSKLAIIVGGRVVSAPVIRSEIGRKGRITGNFTAREVAAMIEQLSQPANTMVESHTSPDVTLISVVGLLCILPTLIIGGLAILLLLVLRRRSKTPAPHPEVHGDA
jgi:serine/threonine protein kinase